MKTNVDVFGTGVKLRLGGKGYGSLVVAVNGSGRMGHVIELLDKKLQVQELACDHSQRDVLCLGGG